MMTPKKPHREMVCTYLLKFGVWGFERLRPVRRWELGGASRLIGAPLAFAGCLVWAIYVAPIIYALSMVTGYLEAMFIWPKGWLKFNLMAGLVVFGLVSISMGAQGIIAALICFWMAGRVWSLLVE